MRTASEVLNDLETRIARLERQSGFFDFLKGKIDFKDIEGLLKKAHQKIGMVVVAKSPEDIRVRFDLGLISYYFKGHFVRNKDRVKVSRSIDTHDSSLLVIEFTPDPDKHRRNRGLEPVYVYIDISSKEVVKSDFKDHFVMNKIIDNLV